MKIKPFFNFAYTLHTWQLMTCSKFSISVLKLFKSNIKETRKSTGTVLVPLSLTFNMVSKSS